MPVYDKIIGRNIRNARKAMGMTQEDVAERLGVSTPYIGKLERGERSVNLDRLASLVPILKVPIEILVQGSVPVDTYNTAASGFLETVGEIVKGCSPKTLDMILELIITAAKYDKE